MSKRSFLLAIIFALLLIHLYFFENGIGYSKKSNYIEKYSKSYKVKSIKLLEDTFEITFLQNTEYVTIEGVSFYKIKSTAKNKIINFLNDIENPRLFIITRTSDLYTVDFIFSQNGQDIKFSEWLKSNRLIYG